MSFFFSEALEKSTKKATIPINTARALGCKVCPLKKAGAENPDLPPAGNKEPVWYFLGTAPDVVDDEEQNQFAGAAGQFLRKNIPEDFIEYCRFNNVVRTRPPLDRKPEAIEIECCKNSIIADIEKTKPAVIIAVGSVALNWLIGESNISNWRGRLFPLKVGNHICWGYAILNPEYIFSTRKTTKQGKTLPSEYDHVFKLDLKRLAEQSDSLEDPYFVDSNYLNSVEWTEGLKADRELQKVLKWIHTMKNSKFIGYDYETNCLRPYEADAKIITIALANDKVAYAFPIDYPEAWSPSQLSQIKDALKDLFLSPVKKICHNVKFEMEWTGEIFGKEFIYTQNWECTQAQAYLMDERQGMHNLDVLIRLNFGFNLKELSNIDRSKMMSYPLNKILPYNGLDAKWTRRLYVVQKAKLEKYSKLVFCYKELINTATTLAAMQMRGICFDPNNHAELVKTYSTQLEGVVEDIKRLPEVIAFKDRFNQTLNPASPEHILRCFKDILGLDHELKTAKGGYSTDEPTLSKLKDQELAKLILKYRGVAKKISTYLEPYPGYVMPKTGRIHTNYNPYNTRTGRLSSDTPNLQNLPNKTGKEPRRMIVPPPGHWMLLADYGQIEARLIGIASQDEKFCEALWNDYDVHLEWAEIIAGEYPKTVGGSHKLNDPAAMKKFRGVVKNQWVFPAFYGAAPHSISQTMGLPYDLTVDIFKDFWRTFSGVKEWQKWLLSRYDQLGYTETLLGIRRRAPLSMNAILNSPIQGLAGQICLNGMNRLNEKELEVIMQVHDDVPCYIPDEKLEESIELIARELCYVPYPFINVPISVEITVGKNWCDQEFIGTFKSTDYYDVPRKLLDFRKLYDFKF
jgi:uracil-DNA glycosylase family 4